ncbi:DUF4136 domain-containing protein [bacterium]|nr:DUF4136 domain-containing protein [bacterium]
MRRQPCIAGLVIAGILAGCAGVHVSVRYDDTVDFTTYGTYRIVRPAPQQQERRGAVRDRLFTQEVIREIKPILDAKGLKEAPDRDSADLLIVFYGTISNQRSYAPPTYHVGRRGRVWMTSPGHVYSIKKGALVIDVVDRMKKELVWQGVGKGVLHPGRPAAELVASVDEILKDFPPQADLAP